MKLDAEFFEKFESFWAFLWKVIDQLLKNKYGEDYKEI